MKKYIQLPSADIAYWIYNPKGTQTMVMVHGFRGNHHGLEDIIAKLPKKYRIIVPDLPGFGESRPFKQGRHDIHGYVQFLGEFINQLNIGQPVLLGHSFGSIITAHFAAQFPTSISKLILVNPIASSPLKGPRAILTQLTVFYYWVSSKVPEKVGRSLLSNNAIVLAMSALLAKTKDKKLRRQIHKNHLTHFSSFQNRQVVLEAFQASTTATAADKAHEIPMPTLLIAGERDDIAPLVHQKALHAALASADLTTIEKVGHLAHYEAPSVVAEAITIFLRKTT